MLLAMGSRQQGPHSTPPSNDDVTHTTLPVMYFSIGSRRRYKKTAGRGVISHLSKYTVSLFILVPLSYVKLFNSSIV